jgi:hypothetical protein
MRAKFQVRSVQPVESPPGTVVQENLELFAVTDKPFDAGGTSEDNSFSRWTPSGELKMTVSNPELFGQMKPGEKYYLDFTKADA